MDVKNPPTINHQPLTLPLLTAER